MAKKPNQGLTKSSNSISVSSVLTIIALTALLTLLPWAAHGAWTGKGNAPKSQSGQNLDAVGTFAISFVPNGRQRNPAIACSPDGRCLSVWEDTRDGSWNIYGQWIINGEAAGENFPISTATSEQRDPAVAYNHSSGEYLVVWWDDRDRVMTGYNIYGRLIASNGETGNSDCPIVVAAGDQQHPDVAYNNTLGEYLVIWQDLRYGDWDIYARRVSHDCTLSGNEFVVSGFPGRQWHPAVAYDNVNNGYLAVWWDNRNSQNTGDDIYGQVFSSDGSLIGSNFPISTADGLQAYPDVTWNSSEHQYLTVWADNRNSVNTGFDIYAQQISPQGELLDDQGIPGADPAMNFAVSTAPGDQDRPVVVYNDEANQHLVAWQDLRYGDWDIFAQVLSGNGGLLDQTGAPGADPAVNFQVSAASGSQERPALAHASTGYVAVWQDSRHYEFVEEDIYGQQISAGGEVVGNSLPLVTALSLQTSPVAAYDGIRNYLVVWQDNRNMADYDIYGQIVDDLGEFHGINFPISAAAGDQLFPTVASDAQGEFLVVWQDSRYGNWDIHGQRLSNEGTLVAGDFEVSTAPSDQCLPALAYNPTEEEYLIVWQDHRSGNWDIYGRCISSDGNQSDSFPIVTTTDNQERPDVVYNERDNEYLVVWQDYRNENWDIYGRRISGQCLPQGNEFAISQGEARQWYPSLAYDPTENQYLVVWWDDRGGNGGDIYGQLVSAHGEMLGENLPISTSEGVQCFPEVAFGQPDNDYLVVWQDYRNAAITAFDIYGQRVAGNGAMKGHNFLITRASSDQSYPSLGFNDLDDQYLVVWQDARHYNTLLWQIYGGLLEDIAVSLEGSSKASPGSNIEYTISYRNESKRGIPNVTITDTLPATITYLSDTAPFSRTVIGNTVVWEIGTLAGGASGQFTLTARVSPTAEPGSLLTNTVQISTSMPESDYSNNSAQATARVPAWTFMVYLNGDNDLDPYTEETFNKMEKAALNPNVNILVLWDRCSLLSEDGSECLDPGQGVENTRLYRVEYDDTDQIASPILEVDWNPGEMDMGDPDTLVSFVTWVRDNYPAKYYFLSILDHGGGWSPTFPEQSEQRLRSLSMDDDHFVPLRRSYHIFGGAGLSWDFSSDYDYLSTAEMRNALRNITMEGEEKIDVVFYDACLAGMLEEAYEIKDYADYFVGSENEAWGSTPYDRYIASITTSTGPRELAVAVVNEYTQSLPLTGHPSTLSALDLAAIRDVALTVDNLARMMMTNLNSAETVSQIRNAYLSTQKFDYDSDFRLEGDTDGYVDLYHLASQIRENVSDAVIRAAAELVMNNLESTAFIVAERHRSGHPWVVTETSEYWNLDNAHGVSIYFPLGQDLQMILQNDQGITQAVRIRDWYIDTNLSFAADTQWDEFIAAYYSVVSPTIPVATLQGPRAGMPPLRWQIYLPILIKGNNR